MPAGRPHKPAALRIVEGNRGKRKIPAEVKIDDEMPQRPAFLHGLALTQWDALAGKLHAVGLLQSVDADALAAYCVSYAQWRDATQMLRKDGLTTESLHGVPAAHPAVGIQQRALASMQQLMMQFGLSPKARANLGTPGKKVDDDPFSKALRNA